MKPSFNTTIKKKLANGKFHPQYRALIKEASLLCITYNARGKIRTTILITMPIKRPAPWLFPNAFVGKNSGHSQN